MAAIKLKGKQYYVIYDYEDEKGNRKQKWESCPTKDSAEMRKAEIELLKAQQQFIDPNNITVKEFFDKWLPLHARKRWSYKTYIASCSMINRHIIPHIGDRPIQKITNREIDELYDQLGQTKKYRHESDTVDKINYGKDMTAKSSCLSKTTVHEIHCILRSAFSKAIDWKYIRVSPIPKDGPKRNTDYERAIWDEKTVLQAMGDISDPELHLAVHMTYIGSLRIGENVAITIDCIDFENDKIFINKTLQRVSKDSLEAIPQHDLTFVFPTVMEGKKSCLILKTPKTKKSKRYMYLTPQLKEEIKQRISEINRNKELLGDRYYDYGLLFCLPNGSPMEPKLLEKKFNDWQKSLNGKYPQLEFHGLRHSSITYKLLISNGDLKTVQDEGGHARANMVTDVYAHSQEKNRIKLSQNIERDFYTDDKKIPPIEQDESLMKVLLEKVIADPTMQKELLLALIAQQGIKN